MFTTRSGQPVASSMRDMRMEELVVARMVWEGHSSSSRANISRLSSRTSEAGLDHQVGLLRGLLEIAGVIGARSRVLFLGLAHLTGGHAGV